MSFGPSNSTFKSYETKWKSEQEAGRKTGRRNARVKTPRTTRKGKERASRSRKGRGSTKDESTRCLVLLAFVSVLPRSMDFSSLNGFLSSTKTSISEFSATASTIIFSCYHL